MNNTMTPIDTRRILHSRLSEVDFDKLQFGQWTADHMLICDYDEGSWQEPRILPFANLALSPATLALHYGQTVFEGMKAFRMEDDSINIFRVERHYERFARSLDRMCMAIPPKELFVEGLSALIALDREWVPRQPGASLYIRPFIYASEAKFGVKVSDQYRFVIFNGPVPELYAKPIRVKVETEYIRAARGGTGFAKCGGNYGGAFLPTQLARKQGYDQVLWTTGGNYPTIEESGMMNAMFVIDDKLVTPALSDSILEGITRDSLLAIARSEGVVVEERTIPVTELEKGLTDGSLSEAFGAGTAAVIAPIGTIQINGKDYDLPTYHDDSLSNHLKHKLNRMRTGREPDIFNWNYLVKDRH